MAVHFSEPALEDLDDIWRAFARRSLEDATAFITRLEDVFGLLEDFPRLGRERSDLRPGIRAYVYRRYVVLYRELEDGVLVEAVIRGDRDIGGMFG